MLTELPEGFDFMRVSFRFFEVEEAHSVVQSVYDGLSGLTDPPVTALRRDSLGARSSVRCPDLAGGHVATLAFEVDPEHPTEADLVVELSRAGSGAQQGPPLQEALAVVRERVNDTAALDPLAWLDVRYELDSEKWLPTVELPSGLPAGVGTLPGVPLLTGVELSFKENSGPGRLGRAMVSHIQEFGRISVRMMFLHEVSAEDVARSAIRHADAHLNVFVSPRPDVIS